jgi:hypothetical protein
MRIDWGQTINEIFSDKISCLRCGHLSTVAYVGYSRSPAVVEYAPRCQECQHKEDCESRKLVVLCKGCAKELRVRAREVDIEGLMTLLLNDCRKDLEEGLDYLAEFWREDLDVDPEDIEKRLEEVAPEVFLEENTWRQRLEEEYLKYHGWFREHHLSVPNPGWRSEYVEEIIVLGYSTLLGD